MAKAWIEHNGAGCPLPKGTLVDILHFNGNISEGVRVGSLPTLDPDGKPISRSLGRWSGWLHSDGGPMGPKIKAYRLYVSSAARERNAEMFRSWLDVRETKREASHA